LLVSTGTTRRRIEEGLAIFHNRLTVHSVAADRTPRIDFSAICFGRLLDLIVGEIHI
jgi:hypothetical protein